MQKFLLSFLLFLSSFLLWAQVPEFKLNRYYGTIISSPNSIAVDQSNYIYVLQSGLGGVIKYNSTGNVVQIFNKIVTPPDDRPTALALDRIGNIYITNPDNATVEKYNPQGDLVQKFGTKGQAPGQIWYPTSLDVDEDGNIYITDSFDYRIMKFSNRGTFIFEFKIPNDNSNDFNYPQAIKVGKSGITYCLTEGYKIFKIDKEGKLIESKLLAVPGLNPIRQWKTSLALDEAENIYATDLKANRVHKFNSSGQHIKSFGSEISISGKFSGIKIGVSIGSNGDLFTSDHAGSGLSSIQIFNQSGELKKKFISTDGGGPVKYDQFDNIYTSRKKSNKYIIVKLTPNGTPVTEFGNTSSIGDGQLSYPIAFALDKENNIYCLDNDGSNKIRIQKFGSSGKYLTKFENFGSSLDYGGITDIVIDSKGFIYLTDPKGGNIRKISPTGNLIGTIGSLGSKTGQLNTPGALALDLEDNIYVADKGARRVQKFDPSGKVLMEYHTPRVDSIFPNPKGSVSVDILGNVYIGNYLKGFISVFNKAGNVIGKIDMPGIYGEFVMNTKASKIIIGGSLLTEYTTAPGIVLKSKITGKVFQDANANCILDLNEKPLSGIIIQTEPKQYYGISDEMGNYTIQVDTGSYILRPILFQEPGRLITPTCRLTTTPLIVKSYNVIMNGSDFGNQVSRAAILHVSVTSNRRRRCMRNITTVSYSNTGFATASNAKVTVQLPQHVAFISANNPHTKDNKGNYIFAVGNLQPNQSGIITIIDSVSCANPNIRGLTVCTKAWITPVNSYPSPPNWNKAEISISGKTVENNQVRFVIRNTGTGNMTDSLNFRVYQDAELTLNSKYKLAVQDSLVLRFTPVGRAVRVEADQPAGHPVKATAGVNIEMPLMNAMRLPSTAMVAYPPNDPESEITEECLPIIDSFDPNDKQVIPAGLTTEKYTPTNSPLRYTVRFQNTGTDVAYRVVVVDTLSADLDLSTFQVGAVSHNYKLTVAGKEKPVLTFTFDNIMLPDSTTNQAGSNGFIQFSIKPKASLPEKTKIENFADIFFDYNEPVRTNTTVNRIFDMPQVLNTEKQLLAQNIITSPAILNFSPTQSRIGKPVMVTGKNFATTASNNKVTFNGVPATVLNATATTLTVQVPNNAFSGKIKVVTPDGSNQTIDNFTIFQPPTLTALSATEGIPGAALTLTGTHFSPDVKQDTVTFNGVSAKVLEATETTLKVEVPVGATIGKVVLKTLGGQVESQQSFRVWYPPVIADFNPGKGKVGKAIILNGNNFAETTARNTIKFGVIPAEVLEASGNRLLIKVPINAASGKIHVQTPGGTTSTPTDFTFIPAPVITAFTPIKGNAGTTVTINGSNFNADNQADTIYFNAIKAKVLKASPTVLEVQAPKGVSSGSITIAGAGGKTITSEFNVLDLATEDAISIYPNPAKGAITVNWFRANANVESLSIYNAMGQLVTARDLLQVPDDELKIELSRFGAGIYTIRLQTSEGTVVKRVVAM